MSAKAKVKDQVVLERQNLQRLLDTLRERGFNVVGPTLRDNAIIFDGISRVEDFPAGWTDEQGHPPTGSDRKHKKSSIGNIWRSKP